MKFIYKNRKHIARILLANIVFILLLAFNFKVWGGSYSEGSLQDIIIHESKELEHCILLNNDNKENVKVDVQIKQLLDAGFANIIIDFILLSFIHFIYICRSKLFYKKRYTLVSLCVRMDD
jgi:hypothetical protein